MRRRFDNFSGAIVVAEDGIPSVTAEIAVDSANSGNEQRDAHIKAYDFFDVEKYPTATFASTGGRADRWRPLPARRRLHALGRERAQNATVRSQSVWHSISLETTPTKTAPMPPPPGAPSPRPTTWPRGCEHSLRARSSTPTTSTNKTATREPRRTRRTEVWVRDLVPAFRPECRDVLPRR